MFRLTTVALVLATAGCVPVAVEKTNDLQPTIAVAGNYGILEWTRDKKPKPPKVCPNCLGKGTVGDVSKIKITCPACNGTGKG